MTSWVVCMFLLWIAPLCLSHDFVLLSDTFYKYLTIIRRRRSEYWWIFPETKSRGIFTNIHEPEANNCFSIITQVIIEIPRQRNITILPQFAIVDKSSYRAARINVSRNAFLNSRFEEKTFSLTFIPGKNKSKCGFVVNGYASLLFSQTMFSYCFCMLSEFAKVFERIAEAYK